MDATQLLKKDHKEVKALLQEFEQLRGRSAQKKQAVVMQICQALTVHAQVEEELVYPLLKTLRAREIKDLVAEAAEEHMVAKTLIGEIKTLAPDDEQYEAKVTVLGEYVQHHVKEEEQELFPKARQHLSAKRLAELGEQIATRKEALGNADTEMQAA
jgi:hemerythrin-like domain-containing protein